MPSKEEENAKLVADLHAMQAMGARLSPTGTANGMFELYQRAADRIEELEEALRRFENKIKAATVILQGLSEEEIEHVDLLNGFGEKVGEVAVRRDPDPAIPVAEQYQVNRHAEKQGCSYADAWRYFEREGYDMSEVIGQYDG